MPPEISDSDGLSDLDDKMASAWDVAVRYHEFKFKAAFKPDLAKLRRVSAFAVIERAKSVLGSVVRPTRAESVPLNEVPSYASRTEIDIDETLSNSPLIGKSLGEKDVWMAFSVPKIQPVILCIDTSLSMTGEKLALTAVALAVVMLQFPEDPVGIVAFENEAKTIKHPDETVRLEDLIERFLDVPAHGYTHLENGMKAALGLAEAYSSSGRMRPLATVLVTDGKYTAGKDPAYLASRFGHLVVLKMGHERSSLDLCRYMAAKGNGMLREVGELEALPSAMYGVVKDVLRGRR